ncbi:MULTISPECIES: hypothetical protein [unclassified Haloferax]|uniref:hypothetical protein n=1 Tax=unclassified Haloferax TaxID=2625095 RepID=UPI002876A3D7|nr:MULTISPECIES: hypothetical protein [unclassified Haloferax]MDS0241065.1 hypothetical protein [Haloferax sp. S2CR25]MDS0444186.1 hypothetical protein [Haloferax sp. S2CR25-2]
MSGLRAVPLEGTAPGQLGYFFDIYPRIAGPVLLGLGIVALIWWYVYDVELARRRWGPRYGQRVLLATLLVVGGFVAGVGFLARGEIIWFYAALVFVIGRVLQGAIFVQFLRKLGALLGRVVKAVSGGGSGGGPSIVRRFVVNRLRRWAYFGVLTVVAFGGAAVALLGGVATDAPAFETVALTWTVFLTISTIGMLLWDLRYAAPDIQRLPLFGLLLCIAGTEVYVFDLPPQLRSFAAPYVTEYAPVVLFLQPMDWVLLVVGQVALLGGVGFATAVLFFGPKDADDEPETDVSRPDVE